MGLEIFSLEGKRALVTGASRGIGAAIAIAFAEAGADVAVSARSESDLDEVAGKARATGHKAVVAPCDVTQRDQVYATVDRAVKELGGIDILVNNAGGSRFMAPLVNTREDGWEKGIRLNLDSVFWFCKAAGQHMLDRGSGSVINIASVAGVRSSPLLSFYGAAKAAVINLTKTLSIEWGESGVRINGIAPGWIKTDLNKALWSDPSTAQGMTNPVPLKRLGEVSDITGAAIFLASDAAAYVTGHTIVVDGGITAGGGTG
ncbi:MAG: SDR family NAD(P)-dependent oxidoreductase [Actinomycetota bacterium]|nr:glucose 1-dehydrogenase [Actinomycetota bacterium]